MVVYYQYETFCESRLLLSFDFMKFVVLSDKLSCAYISRVPDQNGLTLLYAIFEIHHSGGEPSIYAVYNPSRTGLLWNSPSLVLPSYSGLFFGMKRFANLDCCSRLCVGSLSYWVTKIHVLIHQGFPTSMVYLHYISCLRYTILARNPWYIQGFQTRMVYLHYISCLRYTILARNPQYIKGFRPEWCIYTIYHAWDTEWCISTIYHAWHTPFWSGTLDMLFKTLTFLSTGLWNLFNDLEVKHQPQE